MVGIGPTWARREPEVLQEDHVRRSNLPIIFGILFFFVGAAIIFLIVNDDDSGSGSASNPASVVDQQPVTVVIATEDIAGGTFGNNLPAGALRTEQRKAADVPTGAISGVDALVNVQIATNISAGDIITQADLRTVNVGNTPAPEGREGLAVQMGFLEGAAQYVGAGDTINVFVYYEGCEITREEIELGFTCPPLTLPRAELLVTNVEVLAVDRQVAAADASTATTLPPGSSASITRETDEGSITFFLAVSTEDAERIIFAQSTGRLYATLQAPDAGPSPETPGKSYVDIPNRSAESAPTAG